MKAVLTPVGWLLVFGCLLLNPAWIAAQTVTGTVRTDDGTPLAEAEVLLFELPPRFEMLTRLWQSTPGVPRARTQTDTDGRFHLDVPSIGAYKVQVEASDRLGMLYPILMVTSDVELPPVRLFPQVRSQILARHNDGTPLADALAYVRSSDQRFWRRRTANGWAPRERHGRFDAAGKIAIPRVAGEVLAVEIATPGHLAWSTLVIEREESVHRLSDTMSQPLDLELVDESDQPLVGALVGVGPAAQPVAQSDDQGKVRLLGKGGEVIHVFFADGRQARHKLPNFEPSEPRHHRLTAPPLPRLSGRVMAGEKGLDKAVIWPGEDPGRFVLSDAQGRFELSATPSPRFWLQAEADGFLALKTQPRTLEEGWEPLNLQLQKAKMIRGQVVDASGEPLLGVGVEAYEPATMQREIFRLDRAAARTRSQAGGRFELVGLGDEPAFRIEATKPGFSSLTTSSEPGNPLRIQMRPARPALGQVLDQNEKPLKGVEIAIGDIDDPRAKKIIRFTDAEGRFEVDDLPFEGFDLSASKGGYPTLNARLETPPGSHPIDLGPLILIQGVRLAGRVVDSAGKGLAGVRVAARAAPGNWPERPRNQSSNQRPTRSDKDGRFVIHDLLPGQRIVLVAERAGFSPVVVEGIDLPSSEEVEILLERTSD